MPWRSPSVPAAGGGVGQGVSPHGTSQPGHDETASEALLAIHPPEGVRLVGWRPARTGEGGRGLVARYSDGTTASAMVNSDGSVRVLFFRNGQVIPAVPVAGVEGRRFTW